MQLSGTKGPPMQWSEVGRIVMFKEQQTHRTQRAKEEAVGIEVRR